MRYERQDVSEAIKARAAQAGSLSKAVEELLIAALNLGAEPKPKPQQLPLDHDDAMAAA